MPGTAYVRREGLHLAHRVVGAGTTVAFLPGWVSHVDLLWTDPGSAALLDRLASFGRLVVLDPRGTGGSDRVPDAELPALEERAADVLAVLDAIGTRRAVLLGVGTGCATAAFLAAARPERVAGLVLYAPFPRTSWAEAPLEELAPSRADDEAFRTWWTALLSGAAAPATARALAAADASVEIEPALSAVRVPTLVLVRAGDRVVDPAAARRAAAAIPGSRLAHLPGEDHLPLAGDPGPLAGAVEAFVADLAPAASGTAGGTVGLERAFRSVLASEVVSSSTRAVQMGDHRWMSALEAHATIARWHLPRFRGAEVESLGRRFVAAFDGPAAALRFARTVAAAARPRGVEVRAGVHAGAIDITGDPGGAGGAGGGPVVHLAERAAERARAGEVLATDVVRGLLPGSGLRLQERGVHDLAGAKGGTRLYAVTGDDR